MSNEKRYKKGEKIFSEGESIPNLSVIQSGRVSIFLERGENKIQIDELGPASLLGEQTIFGGKKQLMTAEALSEVRVLEIPSDLLKTHFDKSSPALKVLVKGLSDELKRCKGLLKSVRMDEDHSPMPQKLIPKLFSVLNLVTNHIGKSCAIDPDLPDYKKEEILKKWPQHYSETDMVIPWTALKIYTVKMFLDSIVRMENVLNVLAKLNLVSLIKIKDEDDDDGKMILSEIRIHRLEIVELFAEFYQHNLYKPGKAEGIYIDPIALQLTGALVEVSKESPVDRQGVVRLEYSKLLEDLKSQFGIDMKSTHLNALEKKGLFVKRSTVDEMVFMAFDRQEFEFTFRYWQIINEIDKWNKNGIVDMDEDISLHVKEQASSACPSCSSPIDESANFCSQCGFKLAA